jgi:hypothetical protein
MSPPPLTSVVPRAGLRQILTEPVKPDVKAVHNSVALREVQAMTQNLTDWLQQSRLTVVAIDTARGRLRVRGVDEACSDLSCHQRTLVVTNDGLVGSLDTLNPGDIVKIESGAERPEKIVVLRHIWDEFASPEL